MTPPGSVTPEAPQFEKVLGRVKVFIDYCKGSCYN